MNDINPLISVIIPTYNRSVTLGTAIQSVLNQTYQNFELIIIDDGSLDDTCKVISTFSDQRIRYIKHTLNQGAPAARNTGIKKSKGKYIAFLDSDDRWLPEKLKVQLQFLQNHIEFTSCSSGSYRFQKGKGFVAAYPVQKETELLKHILKGIGLSLGSFDENFPRHEDWDWIIRYLKFYDHYVIQQPLAEINPSRGVSPEKIEKANLMIFSKHKRDFYGYGKFYGRKVEALRWNEVAQAYFSLRNTKMGIKYLHKALLRYPLQRPRVFFMLFDSIFGTHFRVEPTN